MSPDADNIPPRLAWRKDGLLKAAAYIGIRLQIPSQPLWTNADTSALMAKSPELQHGYALSWLGHLNTLREAAKYNTALVIEDDADFDIKLRTNMPRIAEAVRNLTRTEVSPGQTRYPPYGMEWDILWLGHCGDSISPWEGTFTEFQDPSVPPYVVSWEKKISPDPNHTRWVHRSIGPICSYAYAVTHASAKKLLDRDDHGSTAFDIWMHLRCKDMELQCFTVNPELFHHHQLAGAKDGLIIGPETEVFAAERTENIWHSARCNSASKSKTVVTCMSPEPKQNGE